MGYGFILEHVLDMVWYWIASRRVGKAKDGFKVEPFAGIMAAHGAWTIWAIVAMIWA